MSVINRETTEKPMEFPQSSVLQSAAAEEPEDVRDIAPVDVPAGWDYETDILIVGGGGSGLCAAAAALRNGAKVLVLEKMAKTGGHSIHGAGAATMNTNAAKRMGYADTRAWAFRRAYVEQSRSTIDPRLLATLLDRGHEVYDWAETESWGERWIAAQHADTPDQGIPRQSVKGVFERLLQLTGTELIGIMYPWMRWLSGHVAEKGGKILTKTKALALVKDGERVVGVMARTADYKTTLAKANMAVILAGSGFTNNRNMIKKYCPDIYKKAVGTFLLPSDTGETTRMALGAGADLAGRDSWIAFAGGIPFFDVKYTGRRKPGPWFQYLRQGWLQLARGEGWLEVNVACEEFLPKRAQSDYEMHPAAICGQPNSVSYMIFDANYPTTMWETVPPPMIDNRPMTLEDPEPAWFGEFKGLMPKNWLDSVRKAIEYGGIKFSDTVEGLAEELGLDPAKLVKAVKTWNAKAAAGKPDEFGRMPANMKPILKAPFYGIKTGPIIGGIFCGPRINYRFEVLDKNFNPIPGLYCAGTNAGGVNGEGVFSTTIFSCLGLAFSSGWIAGDNASSTEKLSYAPVQMALPD